MPTLAGINRAAPELIAATRTFVSRRLDCLPTVRLSRVVTRVARRAHVPSRASMRDFGTASRVSRPARGVAGAKPSGSGAPGLWSQRISRVARAARPRLPPPRATPRAPRTRPPCGWRRSARRSRRSARRWRRTAPPSSSARFATAPRTSSSYRRSWRITPRWPPRTRPPRARQRPTRPASPRPPRAGTAPRTHRGGRDSAVKQLAERLRARSSRRRSEPPRSRSLSGSRPSARREQRRRRRGRGEARQ